MRVGQLRAGATIHEGRCTCSRASARTVADRFTVVRSVHRVSAERPGEIVLDLEHPVVSCPWHNFEFSLETGAAQWNPALCIRVFELRSSTDACER